jgi:hypothetical protein
MLDNTKHFAGLPAALEPLATQEHWVLWKFEIVKDKRTKVPYAPNGIKAKTNDPTTWSSYATVIAAFNSGGYNGIGFCLLNSGVCAFDLDHCRNPETDLLHSWAHALVHERAKSYAEITPSGEGLRVIGLGEGPRVYRNQRVDDEMSCEAYRDSEKYITISGVQIDGTANELINIDTVMDAVVQELDALKNQSSEEEDRDSEGNAELPPALVGLLYIPNAGAGVPHAGYASRSELTFAFITNALRAGITGKTISASCLDETYRGCAIYEHCKQNGGRPYVLRQGKSARKKLKEALSAEVVEINKAHALVLAGNRAVVLKEETVEERTQIRLVQVDGLKQWYANRPITIGIKTMSIAEYWLRHKDRRQYEGIEFAPNGGRNGYYNLFRGFAVEPRAGSCEKFLKHLKDNVAGGNEAHFNWIVGWFAQIVQQVHVKIGTALCLRGKQGVGKTKVGEVFGSLLGDHYELVSDPRYITGQFNAHMASLVVLHADEAFWAGDKRAEGKLKDLVTGFKHRLEFKGVDPILVNNYIRLFVTGNQDWLVPAGFGERRFAIFDVGEANIQDHAYFAAIDAEMNNGGREALLDYLLNFDLSQVNLRKIPQTDALFERILESASAEAGWWYYVLQRGELPWGSSEDNACPKRTLFRRYLQHANLQGARRRAVEVKIGMFLKKHVGTDLKTEKKEYSIQSRLHQATETGYVYIFPDLQKCREKFAEVMRQPIKWDRGADAKWTKEPKIDDDGAM